MRVIRSQISVKTWLHRTPTVDEARPARCVGCGAAARPAGGGLALWGHGLLRRQWRGPLTAGGAPISAALLVRRYDCQRCPAVLTVVPCETAPGRHCGATAIAFALALYGVQGQSHAEVRAAVSSDTVVGVCAERRWCTLPRWIDAVAERDLFPAVPAIHADQPRRVIAQRAAMAIGAHAPPSLPEGAPALRAFVGAALMA